MSVPTSHLRKLGRFLRRHWPWIVAIPLLLAVAIEALPVIRQHRGIKQIYAVGGTIGVSQGRLSDALPAEMQSRLDKALGNAWILPYQNIVYVDLTRTPLRDADLHHFRKMIVEYSLSLAETPVTDEGLIHLSGMTELRVLSLGKTQVTDAGLSHLRGLAGLQELDLSGTQVTNAGVADLQAALPKCVIKK
ncbi:MAG: hypothetical protein KDN20_19535 [Verrucomicrobiae bacterium]|nr:hypothetical protein [Verrucomicrobiae bacterium]